jgi:ubiquinone/menaquinone biosynthesis C-methylase UbiE
LERRIERESIPNITPKRGDAYDLFLPDESVDRIFAIACVPEIPDKLRALREFKRVLKSDGIISLCELFPDPDYPFRSTEKQWAEEAGLEFRGEFGNWFAYQLNFGKKSARTRHGK